MERIVEKSFEPNAELQRSLFAEAEPYPMNNDQEQTRQIREQLEKVQAEQKSSEKTTFSFKRNIRISSCVGDDDDDEEEEDNHSNNE